MLVTLAVCSAHAADWTQFRGPGGLGITTETSLPVEWSSKKNIVWRTKLPGPGTSSPVTAGKRVFVTCYTGYALDAGKPGNMDDLKRHLVCVERASGKILWTKQFDPVLPEHKYTGEGTYHGYASSTPVIDGDRLYVFFGKSGVYCFDLDGTEIWHTSVGKGINGWGSGTSPVLYKDKLIINASVESDNMIALDKTTGKELWKTPGISSAWNTPVLVTVPAGEPELVVSIYNRVLGLSPETGKELWRAPGVERYVCPSVIANDGIVYAIGGGHTSLAVKAGGRGDVAKTHSLWMKKKGSNVSSPVYHEGHIYWASDSGGVVTCQKADTGDIVYQKRLDPPSGLIYSSPLLANGKLYYVSQKNGTYVVAASPEYKLLARNVFADDDSRTNASLAASDGQLLLRSDRYLYCIGKQ
ncbi:MAG: serine/threonine protein kinase [Planctomycetes bacterium]|nr:serine/threonine protein kinase [Planctomycetota bacterium]